MEVHYELFDGIPFVSKWIVVRNGTDKPVRLNRFICEILAAVEPESIVDDSPTWQLPNLMVETDYTFGGMSGPNHSAGVHWVDRPPVQLAGELQPADAVPAGVPSAAGAGPDDRAGREFRELPRVRAGAGFHRARAQDPGLAPDVSNGRARG